MHTTRAKRSLDEGQDELDAKLELLSQLCLQDVTADAHTRRPSRFDDEWIEAEFGWARPARQDLRVFDDEEDGDACTAHLYDPTLFADPRSTHARASSALLSPDHRAYSNKPLPDLPRPSLVRLGVPDAPPSSPLLTAFAPPPPRAGFAPAATPESTPPASPAHSTFLPSLTPPASPAAPAFLAPAETAEPPPPPPKNKAHTFPRATPPDGRGAPQRHGTYPSISSTLELLVERATPREKRSGVYVPDTDDETATQDSHAAPRMSAAGRMRSASEAVLPLAAVPPRRRVRPVLPALATSTSSPSLREIAFSSSSSSSSSSGTMIALTPASATQHDAPQPFPSAEDERQPPSRWSLDSVRPPHAQDSFHPLGARAPASSASLAPTPTPTPTTTRRRDRLISFITRGRSGSLAKPAGDGARRSGSKDALRPSSRDAARRSRASLSAGPAAPPPLPLPLPHAPGMGAMARSASAGSSSASSSASSLPTPAETLADPFSPTSDSFVPACAGDEDGAGGEGEDAEGAGASPPAPTLPLPSPGTPSPSLLAPARPSSLFAALALKRRRKKKLVIAGVLAGAGAGAGAAEQERRYENVMRWCRGFGETRKIEWKEDGSLHVYWKEWEVADRVCRVQAQVYIKDVGRVSLAWHYTS